MFDEIREKAAGIFRNLAHQEVVIVVSSRPEMRLRCRYHTGTVLLNCMGFSETLILVVLAYLLFGPKKLPEIARQVGKILNEFKRASNEFKAQIESEISQLDVEQRRQVLPPAGSVATLPAAGVAAKPAELGVQTSSETLPEPHSLVKAPHV